MQKQKNREKGGFELRDASRTVLSPTSVSTRIYRASNPIPRLQGMAIGRRNPHDGRGGKFLWLGLLGLVGLVGLKRQKSETAQRFESRGVKVGSV